MSRRIVILQRQEERVAPVARVLGLRGYDVSVTASRDEAESLIADRCTAVVIDGPAPAGCDPSLCRWVRDTVRPVPPMVGILAEGREPPPECGACAAVIAVPPGSAADAVVDVVEGAATWWPGDD